MILIGDGSLRRATAQFCEHYHGERSHQGLGNKIINPDSGSGGEGEVQCTVTRASVPLDRAQGVPVGLW